MKQRDSLQAQAGKEAQIAEAIALRDGSNQAFTASAISLGLAVALAAATGYFYFSEPQALR